MKYHLLLVDGAGAARVVPVRIRTLREFPGEPGVSVHFRPVRNDPLFISAKVGGQLAFRILFGEGIVRAQQWVEYDVLGDNINVSGRSADLLFVLTLITARWNLPGLDGTAMAATGVVDDDGAVHSIDKIEEKLSAAVAALSSSASCRLFYPAADAARVDAWRATRSIPPNLHLHAVSHVDEALQGLGYALEKVYLRNPFRGLDHFGYEHRAIFFGRDAEVRDVVAQLLRREAADCPGLLIEGPSGTGKSSFVLAGVLPALIQLHHLPADLQQSLAARRVPAAAALAKWRPGLLPSQPDLWQVVASLAAAWAAYEGLADLSAPSTLDTLADRIAATAHGSRLVWVIDQFEELFTLNLTPAVMTAFAGFLLDLQQKGVWTLATFRTDALPALKEQPLLRQVFGTNEGQYYLAGLTGVAIEEVIRRPALAAGLRFQRGPDGVGLDQLLREAAHRQPDSLPLLQFTLNELYLRRSGRELTLSAHADLGGLPGSIVTTAAGILGESSNLRPEVSRLLRGMVRLDELGRATRRYARLEEFSDDPTVKPLLARLVDARLCVSDQREGFPVAAFAHDSLLQNLPVIVEWLKQEAGLLRTRDLAEREALLWTEHGRSDAWLASADQLVEFRALEQADVFRSNTVKEFLSRSQAKVANARRLRVAAISVIAVLAVIASFAAVIANRKQREAERQSLLTLIAQKQSLAEAAAGRLKDGDLSYARGIIVNVLKERTANQAPSAEAVSVFQDVRALDPLQAVLTGHQNAVLDLAYSSDGSKLVTASTDGTARFWDARTGIEITVLYSNTEHAIHCPRFSPDGSRFLFTTGGLVRLWDAASLQLIATMSDGTDRVHCAAFSPDSTQIAGTAGKDLHIWDARTGREVKRLPAPTADLILMAWSPDGSRLLATDPDDVVHIFKAADGAALARLTGHTKTIYAATFSPDGARVVTAAGDGTARIWDSITGSELFILKPNVGEVRGIAYSPDGRFIATGATNKQARLWDAATGTLLKQFTGHQAILGGVSFSPDSRYLATSGYDGTARVWRVATRPENTALLGHTASVEAVEFSRDGSLVLTGASDQTARVWRADSGAPVGVLQGFGGIESATFSTDGASILSTSGDHRYRIWDAKNLQLLQEKSMSETMSGVSATPDGRRWIATINDVDVGIWDIASGRQLLTLKGHADGINAIDFSPDGQRILTASVDKSARLWDAATGRQLMILPHPDYLNCGSFSPDGTLILTCSNDKALRLWDAHNGEKRMTLLGHAAFVFAGRFSRDGHRIVSGSKDGTVRIWDVHSGVQLGMIPAHEQNVWGVAWAPDGHHVASASRDQSARIWDADVSATLSEQILWAAASEADPLTDVEARRVGLLGLLTVSTFENRGSDCDRAAGAPYDPDRLAPGVDSSNLEADFAAGVCDKALAAHPHDGRTLYERGRVAVAKEQFTDALRWYTEAVAQGYRAALVDLAQLKTEPTAKLLDGTTAQQLLQQAWSKGVPVSAYRLGRLLEAANENSTRIPGVIPDAAQAAEWYARGAAVHEPFALGELARRAEMSGLKVTSTAEQQRHWREAFVSYAQAAEFARRLEWPEANLRGWRYRRATLARLLGRDHLMPQVAIDFAEVIKGSP